MAGTNGDQKSPINQSNTNKDQSKRFKQQYSPSGKKALQQKKASEQQQFEIKYSETATNIKDDHQNHPNANNSQLRVNFEDDGQMVSHTVPSALAKFQMRQNHQNLLEPNFNAQQQKNLLVTRLRQQPIKQEQDQLMVPNTKQAQHNHGTSSQAPIDMAKFHDATKIIKQIEHRNQQNYSSVTQGSAGSHMQQAVLQQVMDTVTMSTSPQPAYNNTGSIYRTTASNQHQRYKTTTSVGSTGGGAVLGTSPIRGKMAKTWFEKTANQAYREFNSSQQYAEKEKQLLVREQNSDLQVQTNTTVGSYLQGNPDSMVSPLQKIYGHGYLQRTGIITAASSLCGPKHAKRSGTAGSVGSRQMASGGMMNGQGIFTQPPSPCIRDPLAYTMSHKTAGPMYNQRTTIGRLSNTAGKHQRRNKNSNNFQQRQSLAEMLQFGTCARAGDIVTNPIPAQRNRVTPTSTVEKRFSHQELAFVLDQKEQYKWIKMHTSTSPEFFGEENGPPGDGIIHTIQKTDYTPGGCGYSNDASSSFVHENSNTNGAVIATVIPSTAGTEYGGGAPALINIQTRDKSQQEQQIAFHHKRRSQQRQRQQQQQLLLQNQAQQKGNQKRKFGAGTSLSAILNLSGGGGSDHPTKMSETHQTDSKNKAYSRNGARGRSLKSHQGLMDQNNNRGVPTTSSQSCVGPYGARKSLFDNTSRDVVSLKRQVPMSRVREYLAGSGKNSENSHHFDKSLAQYFRPQQLGVGATYRHNRNLNNSMTEKVTSMNTAAKNTGAAAQQKSSIETTMNKSQLIPNQPNPLQQQSQQQKSKFGIPSSSVPLSPEIKVERMISMSLGDHTSDNTPSNQQLQSRNLDDEEISVSAIIPAGSHVAPQKTATTSPPQKYKSIDAHSGTSTSPHYQQKGAMRVCLPTNMMNKSAEVSHRDRVQQDSDRSSQWGPGFEDLPPAYKQMLRDLRSDSNRQEFVQRQEEVKREYQKAVQLMNSNMLSKWTKQQNKFKGGRGSSQAAGRATGGTDKNSDSALNAKSLIKCNLDERMGNLIEALFTFWKRKHQAIPAQKFFKRMTTFGLAPDLKFIEQITNIVYSNRPRPAQTVDKKLKRRSIELSQNGSQSNLSHRSKSRDRSVKPGDSIKHSKSGSARGERSKTPTKSRNAHGGEHQKSTICSAVDRTFNKDGEEICKWVKLSTFKSIYGHGTEVKFVKLLLLLLKKQIARFIENKNAQAKCHNKTQQMQQRRRRISKNNSSSHSQQSLDSSRSVQKYKKRQRHSLIEDLEYERKRARDRNQEHKFYRTALNCQQERIFQPKLLNSFNFSMKMQRKRKQQMDNGILNESCSPQIRSMSPNATSHGEDKQNLRYSLKQYEDLMNHIWSHQLDTEGKNEIPEGKFFRFLRDQKIITEKKQLDEMYQQCLFAKKGEEVSVGATVPYTLYQRLFAKPLLLIGIENALSLIENTNGNRDQYHHSASPQSRSGKAASTQKQIPGQPPGAVWPEMDTSSLGQTMAVVGFHRKYMKHVFTSDELDQYTFFKKETRRIRKMQKERMYLDPTVHQLIERRLMDPLKQLEAYRASKQGLEELQPFGIDKAEAIKVMSYYGDIWLAKKKRSKDQLKRKIEAEITLEMVTQKRHRANYRSEARSQGIPVDPTTSESEQSQQQKNDEKTND